jgi:small multidrug resistance pump
MMVLSTLLTVGGYAGLEYKNGAVIESLGFVLVMFLSRIFFEEKITKKKLWGNILILLGIFVFYS